MSLSKELGKLETGFWRGTRNYYDEHLADECFAVYPEPAGIMSRDEILRSIDDLARWEQVELEDIAMIEPTPGVAILTYRATASRAGSDQPYRALVGSVYVKQDDVWKLAFNQQTPL